MIGRRLRPASLLLLLGLAACSREPASGPVDPKWDRAACERCRMVVSDRRHAAQLRLPGGRPHHFDDLGCALLWLDSSGLEAQAAAGQRVELWVRDAGGRRWIDGWQVHYESGLHSPMGYGFASSSEGATESLEIGEVRQRLREIERSRRAPGG